MSPKEYARGAAGVLAGMVVISVLVEGVELALVTAVNGGLTTDPEVYLGIRNRGWVLALKLVYNTAGAIVGGYVAAAIARLAPGRVGLALALVQTVAFLWAVATPDMRASTPDWMWAALIVVSFVGIMVGARLRERRGHGI